VASILIRALSGITGTPSFAHDGQPPPTSLTGR
jgi:hypothetical protein